MSESYKIEWLDAHGYFHDISYYGVNRSQWRATWRTNHNSLSLTIFGDNINVHDLMYDYVKDSLYDVITGKVPATGTGIKV